MRSTQLLAFSTGLALLGTLATAARDSEASGTARTTSPCESVDQGPVYLYGDRLSRPYRFSGMGSDTLLLNGLPFQPARRRSETVGGEPRKSAMAKTRALRSRLDAEVATLLETFKSPTLKQRLDAIERIYRAAPEVEWVTRYENGLDYKVRGIEGEQAIMFGDPDFGQPDSKLEIGPVEIHQRASERFWTPVCAGHLVAAGSDYRIVAPIGSSESLMRAIERVRSGETLSDDEAGKWPMLVATPFARDLRASRGPGDK